MIIFVSESSLDLIAHIIGDGIVLGTDGVNGRLWMLNNLSILDELSSDLSKVAIRISVELGDNGEWSGGVNGLAFTIEVPLTNSKWVEIATIFVAHSVVSMIGVGTAGHWVLAFCLSIKIARMRCES